MALDPRKSPVYWAVQLGMAGLILAVFIVVIYQLLKALGP